MNKLKTLGFIILIFAVLDMPAYILYNIYIKKPYEIKTEVIYGGEIIKEVKTSSKYNKKTIFITNSFVTPTGVPITIVNQVERKKLDHLIALDMGYFLKTEMPYSTMRYSYKWFGVGVSIGYSFKIKKIDYGILATFTYKF